MNKVYLLLGSNQKNPAKQLARAVVLLNKQLGQIIRQSSIYETAAWGNTKQSNFLNQIIVLQTNFTAAETLQKILSIEKKMGRVRTIKNAPRSIDIDILFFNKEIINEDDLIVPHPLLQQRKFVLTPLNELSPNLKHPVLQKTIHHLLRICKDKLAVTKITAN
jgi:2-amino-4-hydroxy-6-hydroxymethyldihydropteridine diphosphokinase